MCIKAAIIKLKTYIVFKNAFVPSVYSRDLVIQWLAEIQQEKLDEMDDETMKGFLVTEQVISCIIHIGSVYRGGLIKLCRSMVVTWFRLDIEADQKEDEEELIRRKVASLIGSSRQDATTFRGDFLRAPAQDGTKSPLFSHTAFKTLALELLYNAHWIQQDHMCPLWSTVPPPVFAYLGTGIYAALNEFRTGQRIKTHFTAMAHEDIYKFLTDSIYVNLVQPKRAAAHQVIVDRIVRAGRASCKNLPGIAIDSRISQPYFIDPESEGFEIPIDNSDADDAQDHTRANRSPEMEEGEVEAEAEIELEDEYQDEGDSVEGEDDHDGADRMDADALWDAEVDGGLEDRFALTTKLAGNQFGDYFQ